MSSSSQNPPLLDTLYPELPPSTPALVRFVGVLVIWFLNSTLCLFWTGYRQCQRLRGGSTVVQWWWLQHSTAGKIHRHSQAGVRRSQSGEEVTEGTGKNTGCTLMTGRFYGKPAGTESRNPSILNYQASVSQYFCVTIPLAVRPILLGHIWIWDL